MPRYFISFTTAISSPPNHHFLSLLGFPPFLNTTIFVLTTFIFKLYSSQKSFIQLIALCNPIIVFTMTMHLLTQAYLCDSF
jgi:hypothetical protein